MKIGGIGDWLRKSMDGNPNGSFKKVSSVEYQIPLPLDWGLKLKPVLDRNQVSSPMEKNTYD